jgi:hypothetical protein
MRRPRPEFAGGGMQGCERVPNRVGQSAKSTMKKQKIERFAVGLIFTVL